jgi:hypothetical protein
MLVIDLRPKWTLLSHSPKRVASISLDDPAHLIIRQAGGDNLALLPDLLVGGELGVVVLDLGLGATQPLVRVLCRLLGELGNVHMSVGDWLAGLGRSGLGRGCD